MSDLKNMITRIAKPGRVEAIYLRSSRRIDPNPVEFAELKEAGLEGDHSRPGKRALTLIQFEHIPVIASLSQCPDLTAQLLRRNIVISGLNLNAFRGQKLQVGRTIVELTVPCHPCSRMEELLGHGGYTAMRGHGGFCANVVQSGKITIGDTITSMSEQTR